VQSGNSKILEGKKKMHPWMKSAIDPKLFPTDQINEHQISPKVDIFSNT